MAEVRQNLVENSIELSAENGAIRWQEQSWKQARLQ